MALINSAQPGVCGSFVTSIVEHVIRVWQDPSFQKVLKREARRFVVSIASEARASSLRNRG